MYIDIYLFFFLAINLMHSFHDNIMLNSKRSFKDNVYNGGRSRSKSIYNGNHSHALSMNLLIENNASPDKLAHFGELKMQHKYSQKENARESYRAIDVSAGKRSYR